MRSAGLSTRCDFIKLKAGNKAKPVAQYVVDCPAAVLQLCWRFVVYLILIMSENLTLNQFVDDKEASVRLYFAKQDLSK